jgi:hypothetical protein
VLLLLGLAEAAHIWALRTDWAVDLVATYAISHYEPRVQGRANSTCFICSPWKGGWNLINRITIMLCTP